MLYAVLLVGDITHHRTYHTLHAMFCAPDFRNVCLTLPQDDTLRQTMLALNLHTPPKHLPGCYVALCPFHRIHDPSAFVVAAFAAQQHNPIDTIIASPAYKLYTLHHYHTYK